jgi:hypothetical protein
MGCCKVQFMDPLLSLVYINDLLKLIKYKAIPILFTDNTRILTTSPNNIQFQNELNIVLAKYVSDPKLICFP